MGSAVHLPSLCRSSETFAGRADAATTLCTQAVGKWVFFPEFVGLRAALFAHDRYGGGGVPDDVVGDAAHQGSPQPAVARLAHHHEARP